MTRELLGQSGGQLAGSSWRRAGLLSGPISLRPIERRRRRRWRSTSARSVAGSAPTKRSTGSGAAACAARLVRGQRAPDPKVKRRRGPRLDRRYCSNACRQAAYRARRKGTPSAHPPPPRAGVAARLSPTLRPRGKWPGHAPRNAPGPTPKEGLLRCTIRVPTWLSRPSTHESVPCAPRPRFRRKNSRHARIARVLRSGVGVEPHGPTRVTYARSRPRCQPIRWTSRSTTHVLVIVRVALVALVSVLILGCTMGSAAVSVRGQPATVTRTAVLRWPSLGHERSYVRRFTAPPGYLKRVRILMYGVPVPYGRFVAAVACKSGNEKSPAFAQQAWIWSGYSLHLLVHLRTGRCSEAAGRFVRVKVVMTSVGT